MTVYCSECGAEIESDADFCYRCGALKKNGFVLDDNGYLHPVDLNTSRVCPHCGYTNTFNDSSCQSCGAPFQDVYARRTKTSLTRNDLIKIVIGLLLAAFGVCGVGHLLYRQYSRGIMYLILSLVILYVEISVGYSTSTRFLFIRLAALIIFLRSSFDLMRIAYTYKPDGNNGGSS